MSLCAAGCGVVTGMYCYGGGAVPDVIFTSSTVPNLVSLSPDVCVCVCVSKCV